jgi:hypothetical protein
MNLQTTLEVAAALITVVAAIYGVVLFIDRRIESKIRDDSFLRKLAGALRPSVIFNHAGSVLVDQGAMRYIDSIEIGPSEEPPYPSQVILRLNQHLAHAPLLAPLEGDLVNITSARGKKHDWVYTLDYFMTSDERTALSYRVEIIL